MADLSADPGSRDGAIHGYFGLSYANNLVLPRTLLQSMPLAWQEQFVGLLGGLDNAFADVEWGGPCDIRYLARDPEHIDREECFDCHGEGRHMRAADDPGEELTCGSCDGDGMVDCDRWETPEEVGVIADPVPHYSRGRTRIERTSAHVR